VKIFWTLEDAEEPDLKLVFSWHEIHSRLHAKPDHPGFGYTVLTHLVPERLNGLASLELKPGEVRWTLRAALTC
jgi:hypothetical protein